MVWNYDVRHMQLQQNLEYSQELNLVMLRQLTLFFASGLKDYLVATEWSNDLIKKEVIHTVFCYINKIVII